MSTVFAETLGQNAVVHDSTLSDSGIVAARLAIRSTPLEAGTAMVSFWRQLSALDLQQSFRVHRGRLSGFGHLPYHQDHVAWWLRWALMRFWLWAETQTKTMPTDCWETPTFSIRFRTRSPRALSILKKLSSSRVPQSTSAKSLVKGKLQRS